MGNAAGHFSVTKSGTLAYSRGEGGAASTLREADRSGKFVGGILNTVDCVNPSLSPDGRRLLFETTGRSAGAGHEIWVRDLERGTEAKLTFTQASARAPVWSPDGRRFACELRSGSRSQILIGSSDGLGAVDTFAVEGLSDGGISQWAASTGKLVYGPGSFRGAFTVSPDSAKHVEEKIPGMPQFLAQSILSPDGRWLAYATNEATAQPQVYVQSVTGEPGRWQVSTKSGFFPVWTKGGRELVYEANGTVMAVDVEAKSAFSVGEPRPLFALPQASSGPYTRSWNCSADAQRFFVLVPPRTTVRGGIEVVTDFNRLVQRK
jgi:hypothetical protein